MPSSKRKYYLRRLIKVKKDEKEKTKKTSDKPGSKGIKRPQTSMSGKRFKKPS